MLGCPARGEPEWGVFLKQAGHTPFAYIGDAGDAAYM